MSWLKYAGKRLLMLIPVIICVTFVLFLILSAAPRRPGTFAAGRRRNAGADRGEKGGNGSG